jgi:GTP-binding protein
MIPVIALVGRPNVGKSTLFNRLTRSRDALVANLPGLTRDRKYGEARFNELPYIVIDTGGITGEEEGIDAEMAEQSLAAVSEADVVFLLVDARAGLTGGDQQLVAYLRQTGKAFYLVVNKVDGVNEDLVLLDFYALGVEQIFGITASHGQGVKPLMEAALTDFESPTGADSADSHSGIRVAIVGRPNVGKSTLVNRMLGEDRVVVFDQPGTTRDSIYIDYERDEQKYVLIDTAGIRRRKNVKQTVEKFSIVKTLKAIDDAHVVVLLMDASEGLVDQDLHLLGQTIEAGRGLVVALNKWDGLESDDREWIKSELQRRLQFIDYADIHFISALHGTGVGHLYKSINQAYDSATRKLATNQLTRILEDAVSGHEPPMINGRRIKLRYAHAGGQNPPLIIIHGNQTGNVPRAYQRYLEKIFRRELKLFGTPVRISFRTGENPFENKRNQLTERQAQRKRRLTKYPKKPKH